MPGIYVVKKRSDPCGRAGLMLPFTPTSGPLVLNDKHDLRVLRMGEPCWGDVATENYAGLFTEGISDCSAIAIVEWRNNQWRRYYFEHLAGSQTFENTQIAARIAIDDAGRHCYAVVAQYYGGSAFVEADGLLDGLGVPMRNRSYYQSKFSGMNFGLRFFGGEFGEFNPWCHD